MKFQKPKGTRDLMPDEMAKRRRYFEAARKVLASYGYGEIMTPAFETLALLEAKGFWLDISLDAPNLTPSIEESEDFMGGLPTVGLALDINPHKILNIFAEVSGIYAGNYGYFLDGEVGVKIIPMKSLSLFGGYRVLDLRAEDDPDFAKLRILGPFAGITLRF